MISLTLPPLSWQAAVGMAWPPGVFGGKLNWRRVQLINPSDCLKGTGLVAGDCITKGPNITAGLLLALT